MALTTLCKKNCEKVEIMTSSNNILTIQDMEYMYMPRLPDVLLYEFYVSAIFSSKNKNCNVHTEETHNSFIYWNTISKTYCQSRDA